MVNRLKMLFLEVIIILPGMLIIRKKDILVLGEGPTDESDDTTITV